jgi:hypothetical protein
MKRITPAALLALSIMTFCLAPLGAHAASPSSGTLKPPAADTKPGEKAKLGYDGGAVVGALVFSELAAHPVCDSDPGAPPPGQCDVFNLSLDLPAGFWAKRALAKTTGYLEVTIDWSDQPAAEEQDVDLLVTTASGEQVAGAETDNISSGVPHETARLAEPSGGDYRIVAAGIIGSVPAYKGTVRFVQARADIVNTLPGTSIQFGPSTVANPTLFGGEPGLNGDPTSDQRWWIDWPVSSRANMGVVLRSSDGGETFRMMTDPACPNRRQAGCFTGGGGDTEIALAKDGTVYFSNQELLANEAACVSLDHGKTWPMDRCNAITSLDATNDRQWLAAYDKDLAYISASVAAGVGFARTEDGGKSWIPITPVVGEFDGPSAPLIVDHTGGPNDGAVFALSRGGGGMAMNVSRDKGTTWKTFPCCGAAPIQIPWLAMDSAGNLYAAWSDESTHAAYVSSMLASSPSNAGAKLGSAWSKPVRVSMSPATSTVFTQIVAGDPGRIAIAFQGAHAGQISDDTPAATEWRVYSALSTNALCQWTKTCTGGGPLFEQTTVSERINHYGTICTSGLACDVTGGDRSLLDFFDIGMSPDGRVGVVWSDDNNALGEPSVMFARIANGPSLRRGTSFRAQRTLGLVSAKRGDATWPVNSDGAQNYSTLDLTGGSASLGAGAVTVKMNLASAAGLAAGLGAGYPTASLPRTVKYVTRWHSANEGCAAVPCGDIYFVAAEVDDSGTKFYGGRVDAGDELYSPVSGPTAIFGTKYVPDFTLEGSVTGNTISIKVPAEMVGSPTIGTRLYSVQTFAMVGHPDALTTLYTQPDTIDATAPYDVRFALPSVKKPGSTVRGKSQTRKGPLAATGVADDAMLALGLMLLAGSAVAWRVVRKR